MFGEPQPRYPFVGNGPLEFYLDPSVPHDEAYTYLAFMGANIGAILEDGSQLFPPIFVMRTMEAARKLLNPIDAQAALITGLETNPHLKPHEKELSLAAARQALERFQA